jgi:ADP-heptose:LPS heptosyltransferase
MNKNIIINFPTNIGDTIMCLPVLDRMRANFPQAKIIAITSNKTEEFLKRNNYINDIIVFNKRWPVKKKISFALSLIGEYDIFVDLKNSFLPVISASKDKTPFWRKFPANMHAKDVYLQLIKKIASKKKIALSDFSITDQEREKWDKYNFEQSLFIACSSRSSLKQYPKKLLKTVIEKLKGELPIIILGEESDRAFYADILTMKGIIDLVGKTKINDVFYLLKNYAKTLLCVDSSILHLGSYLNLPIVALFGPTNPEKYGPWSDKFLILRQDSLSCVPCKQAECNINYDCMKIPPQQVIDAVLDLYPYVLK